MQPRVGYQTFSLDSPDFPVLRGDRSAYVDKTGAIADLLMSEEGMRKQRRAFFARPRKFGKSLTLSVAAEMLAAGELPQGVKPWPGFRRVDVDACFGGLAVHERLRAGDASLGRLLRRAHFVIKLGLGGAQTGAELKNRIVGHLAAIAGDAFGDALKADVRLASTPDKALELLVSAVPLGVPVAVLVDEYDLAIINDVTEGEWAAAKSGFNALRSLMMASPNTSARIERCLVTGVARFAHTSLFSGANSFADLTGSPLLSRVLGFSEAEIRAFFPEELKRLAAGLGVSSSTDAAVAKLAHWYSGYCFDGVSSSFNPFPVLQALRAGTIMEREMVAATGTNWLGLLPRTVLERLADELASSADFDASNVDLADLEAQRVRAVPLLLQTGLLALAPGPVVAGRLQQCRVPNEYSRQSLQLLVSKALAVERPMLTQLGAALLARSHRAFTAAATRLLEAIPRTLAAKDAGTVQSGAAASPLREAVFHANLFGALAACAPAGVSVRLQVAMHSGVADLVVQFSDPTSPAVWIFELGVGTDALAKLQQAQAYAGPYIGGAEEVLCCSIVVADAPSASKATRGSRVTRGKAARGSKAAPAPPAPPAPPALTPANGTVFAFMWSRRRPTSDCTPAMWEIL